MSQMIRIFHGEFGRVAILDLGINLVEHAHADCHLKFWLGGEDRPLKIADRWVPFDDQNAVAINSWEPHAAPMSTSAGSTRFLLFYLKPEWLSQQYLRLGLPREFRSLGFSYSARLHVLVEQLVLCLTENENPKDRSDINNLINTIVIESVLTMKHERSSSSKVVKLETQIDPRVGRSLDYMKTNLDIRASFKDVARAAGISRPHFFALFRKQMNMTPSVYWNTVRMEAAIRRLMVSDIALIDLSHDVGFSEQANFSRFFRNHAGVCPSEYRSAISQRLN